jgi:hypothetical protein
MGCSLTLDRSRSITRLLLIILGLLVIVGSVQAEGWADKVTLKGDIRHRFEWYAKSADSVYAQRYRNRVRARIGVIGTPTDNLELGVQLASGGSDPVSTNQTFDDAFTTKPVMLDRAYFKLDIVDGLWLEGGKYGVPWELASSAFWDGDLAVEGATVGWDGDFDAFGPFVNLNYLWVDEISSDPADLMLHLGQGGATFSFGGVKLLVAANYFTYTNIMEHGALYDDNFFGNSSIMTDSNAVVDPADPTDTTWEYEHGYEFGYDVIQPSLKVGLKLGEFPIGLYADLVYNLGADENNMGYMFGLKLGKAKDPGSFEIGIDYGMLQRDCTQATFVDSDFGGGGTDVSGFKFGAKYQLNKYIQPGLTFFYNTQKISSDAADQNGYLRVQADLAFKF